MTAAAQPMLARRQLRLCAIADLRKIEGVTVQSPGNWATPPEKLPALLVKTPAEMKQSINRGLPEFNTTVTLQIEGRLQASAPEEAQDALDSLCYEVEETVLKGHWINQIVQQFASVSTEVDITSEGKGHIAGFRMRIECETFEVFDQTATPPEESTWPPDDPRIVALQGVDVHLDAVQPFDPSGTYPAGDFPQSVQPAPRTSGPDGRDEGTLAIDLPQT